MNNVMLMGRFTADPELRHTTNDVPYTFFTVAVDRNVKSSEEGKSADFISVIAWRKTAEFVVKNFCKGKPVVVHGRIQTSRYDKDGETRHETKVAAVSVEFVPRDNTYSGGSNSAVETDGDFGAIVRFEELTNDEEELPF